MTGDTALKASSVHPFQSGTEWEGSFLYEGERRVEFNDDWRFQREIDGSIASVPNPNFKDCSWRKVNLPHDWSIELDFNPNSPATHEAGYLDGGIGWYRKTFTIPSSMSGKKISIDFDGVYMDSTTYLNGELVGTYPFGYNAFSYDITDRLYADGRENVLVVKVNNTQPSSRWYSGSGIYRNVYLRVTDPIHVARYGTFVTTPELEKTYALGRTDVNIITKINNESGEPKEIKVKSTILDADRAIVSTVWSKKRIAEDDTETHFEDQTVIEHPELWDIDNPYRYNLVTEVIVDEEVVDTYETPFGVRYFEFNADEGFSLNGRYMKLHGVCMHHDLGALGSATNARAVERQMEIMKEMGVNSIRVTHNPASPELLEAANNLGLLVVDEAFDSWNQAKKTYDYSRFFSTWAKHDVKEMVDRGKNEPSIIMWSIGNEIYDTTNESGVTTAKNLVRWIKEIDTTRPTTIGEDKTRADKVNVTPINKHIKEIFDAVDIVGLNYSENNYLGYHEQNPDWKIYGAETSSATRSRGVYTHPYSYNQSTQYADLQQSSYDNDYVGWGRTAEDAWKYDRDLKHIAGQYIWTGFDYIGEPTPYYNTFPANSSYFGAVDTAGFPKDVFYYYQSQWKEEPVVHILPHWNWTEGETVRVLAYTNAHKVELFLNGKSLGEESYVVKKTSWRSTYKETIEGHTYLEWAVSFEPGVLTAVGKDENDQVIAEDKIVTAGEPASVRLTADRHLIRADGKDVSFVTVDIIDAEGNIVPTANHFVSFRLEGSGELAGVDNGDPASIEKYKNNGRQAFNGKALAIVQSRKQAGPITLKASVEGILGDSVEIIAEQSKYDVAKAEFEIKQEKQKLVRNKELDKFTTTGSVEGTDRGATAEVPVRRAAVAVEHITLAVLQNQLPKLPRELTVYFDDGTEKQATVIWDEIPRDGLREVGRMDLKGVVEVAGMTAKAGIRITNEIGGEQNISRAKNGYDYPKVKASFTNGETASNDKIEAINDDLISYEEHPHNRWTNWQQEHRPSDWVEVTFGDYAPVEYDVDNIELHWYGDTRASHPASFKIQYKSGESWIDVVNLQSNPSSMTLRKANSHIFDTVRTSAIRIDMIAEAGMAIAMTELKILTKWPKLNSIPIVSDIKLGNQSILDDFDHTNGTYEYRVQVSSLEEIQEITATGEENTSITIATLPDNAKIIVKSEDGKRTDLYTIYFTLDK